ncbi:MAG TPA: 50S ribosomal protein L10 [Chloroflexota bacterium]|nr:50S ribosomal protein L10 [Chloroflexota bacterium]HEX2987568.1 50S ribosomal protein L10 [Chloroflexota bacterium]
MPKGKKGQIVREKKAREVDELTGLLSRSNLVVLADYRGLSVTDMAGLRRKLRGQGIELKVAKNTLTTFAAEKAGKGDLKTALTGPTAIAFVTADEAAGAKTLSDFEHSSKVFKIKGGLLGAKALTAGEIGHLATMPPREVLLAQVVAGFQAPIAGMVGVLGGVLSGFVGTLEARRRQLEEQGAAS